MTKIRYMGYHGDFQNDVIDRLDSIEQILLTKFNMKIISLKKKGK